VQGMLMASVTPDNTPHGYNLTFAFPMLMFIIVAGALYLRFRRPHRVPGHVALASSRWASTGAAAESKPEPVSAAAPAAPEPAAQPDLGSVVAETPPAAQPDLGSAVAETVMKEIPEGAE